MSGPWSLVWYNVVPLKVQFFIWTAVLERISMMDMLWRKGFALPSICLFCNKNSKSIRHIFLQCPCAAEVWCGVAKDFGVNFIAPKDLLDLLVSWKLNVFTKFGKRLWKNVLATVCWVV